MISTRRTLLPALASVLMLSAAVVSRANAAPDPAAPGPVTATLTLSAQGAAAGVGYTWGDGILMFHGKKYRFSVNGVSIADVGYSKVTGHGRVYHLKNVQDFSGTYAATTGQATVGNGLGGQLLQNANGVQIRIDQMTRGARLEGSVGGITLTLK
ncbi:MAG: hypothetical protein RQ966_00175 [Acetobacteraceae bacterium]|nr:hypothetical protein [Acetobacteraceae bacterium]